MLTLESRRFPVLGEVSCFVRTLPNRLRNKEGITIYFQWYVLVIKVYTNSIVYLNFLIGVLTKLWYISLWTLYVQVHQVKCLERNACTWTPFQRPLFPWPFFISKTCFRQRYPALFKVQFSSLKIKTSFKVKVEVNSIYFCKSSLLCHTLAKITC